MRSLALVLLLALCGCTGYWATNGAGRYCADDQGRAIYCPTRPDSIRSDSAATDTTTREGR